MPASIFTGELEQKLLEIWSTMLRSTDKKMVTRLEKEQKATEQINIYATEIGHHRTFSVKEVSNKIDTLKKRGRQVYDQHKKKTCTGSEVVDLEAASSSWESFAVFHRVFGDHPTWGVGQCRDTASLSSTASSNSASSATADGDSGRPTPSPSADIPELTSPTAAAEAEAEAPVAQATPTASASGIRLRDQKRKRNRSTPVECVSDSSGDDDERRPKKLSRADRASQKSSAFLEGISAIQSGQQCRQHMFEDKQAEKHREWMDKRDQERNAFDVKLQEQMEGHQQTMARDGRDHIQQLGQSNMRFMYDLFHSGPNTQAGKESDMAAEK